jgi:hypothetical protein
MRPSMPTPFSMMSRWLSNWTADPDKTDSCTSRHFQGNLPTDWKRTSL